MNILPPARQTDIVVQELGKELLVYDLKTHLAYQLNETSMIVYQACDGRQTFDDLKRQHKFTDDLIYLTLDALKEKGLLAGDYASPLAGLSRREVIRKIGLASMIALPVISGLVAPTAVAAASVLLANNQTCTMEAYGNSTECQSGNCASSRDADAQGFTLRCCAGNPGFYGTHGFSYGGSGQINCDLTASHGFCCSGAATFVATGGGFGTCTCT